MGNPPMKVVQTEKSFQAQVEQLAWVTGWKVFHPRYSFGSSKGFPDLVLVSRSPPRLIFAELKREGKNPTHEQQAWLDLLGAVPGVETYLWRPSDWDEIVTILGGADGLARDEESVPTFS